jgi:hypothetical protein
LWEGFENKLKAKRAVNCKRKRKDEASNNIKVDQLTVQRLSSDVSGKAQKFSRIGPREFVQYPYGDLTMSNIKKACEDHFLTSTIAHFECDVLAGEQGPSCRTLDQVPNLKLIHVRFVGKSKRQQEFDDSFIPSENERYDLLDICSSSTRVSQAKSLQLQGRQNKDDVNPFMRVTN